jgi:dolichol-phosphate mannosyltransferase
MRYTKGDTVVYMDTDLQDPPELIPKLYQELNTNNADVVYTTRTKREGEGFIKLFFTRIGYWILNKVSQVPVPMNSGDFKMLTRRVVNELIRFEEKKPFVRGLVSYVGFKQVQVFYERESRLEGKTHFPIFGKKVINNFLDSALISFSDAPLKFALFLGGLSILFAGFFLIWIVIQKLIGWAIPGWSAIMATIVLIGGIQIFLIGVIGLYLNSIFIESKKRPSYIVKDTLGF